MEAKQIGSLLGAAALAIVPTAGGFMAYGASKEKGNSNVASSLIGGATLTGLAIAVGLANFYILGLDTVTDQLQNLLAKNTTSGMGLLSVQRRKALGLLDVSSRRRSGGLGLIDVTRMGSCVGCAPRF